MLAASCPCNTFSDLAIDAMEQKASHSMMSDWMAPHDLPRSLGGKEGSNKGQLDPAKSAPTLQLPSPRLSFLFFSFLSSVIRTATS